MSRRAEYAQIKNENHTIEMNNALAASKAIISAIYEQLAVGATLAWCL